MPTPTPEFVITRLLDAPQGLVYKCWTEAERLEKWWGPAGFQIRVHKLELKSGGMFLYSMRAVVGDMWGRFIFRELVPSEKIVFVNSFSDPDGDIVRAPFNAHWPLEVLNTLTLSAEGNKTRIELRGGPINATEAECQNFLSAFPSMQHGFGGSLDQLSVYLMLNKS
ncbi:MAG: SRPBCC domain-containing protein [Bacteroidia bacterium]